MASDDFDFIPGLPHPGRSAQPVAAPYLTRLDAVEPDPVRWLWPGRIPFGKLTLLVGDPGLGKSLLTLTLAACLSQRWPLPGEAAPPRFCTSLLLSAEEGLADTVVPRLQAAGADLTCVSALTTLPRVRRDETGALGIEETPPTLPDDLPELEQSILATDARFVAIDPLSAYLAPRIQSAQDQDVRRALSPLADLAERTGAAVMVVAHLSKAARRSVLYRVGGSIGITAAARSVLLFAADPKYSARRIVAPLKSNLAAPPPSLAFRLEPSRPTSIADLPPAADSYLPTASPVPNAQRPMPPAHQRSSQGAPRLVYEGISPLGAAELLGPAARRPQPAHKPLDEAGAFLLRLLEAGPRPAQEVLQQAHQAGIAIRTLRRARLRLDVVTEKESFTGPWLWRLTSPWPSALPPPKG